MGGSTIAPLADRALLRVSGDEARKFLQGLVTCDLDELAPGGGAYGALLSPQGKILFDFFIIGEDENAFLIDVAKSLREELARRLTFYKLRARVTIAPADELSAFAAWGEAPEAGGGFAIADPRLAEMGWRIYSTVRPAGEEGNYERHRIGLGVPEGGKDYVHGDCFPHEALMDQFGGVDFAKGCYVGQEVVSRMQHRGTARARIVAIRSDSDLPPASTEVLAGGKPAGTMGSSSGTIGLARLRLDRVRQALDAGGAVTVGAQVVEVSLQPWVRFGWPQE